MSFFEIMMGTLWALSALGIFNQLLALVRQGKEFKKLALTPSTVMVDGVRITVVGGELSPDPSVAKLGGGVSTPFGILYSRASFIGAPEYVGEFVLQHELAHSHSGHVWLGHVTRMIIPVMFLPLVEDFTALGIWFAASAAGDFMFRNSLEVLADLKAIRKGNLSPEQYEEARTVAGMVGRHGSYLMAKAMGEEESPLNILGRVQNAVVKAIAF